jgi:RimJ/RimL family protein N-acetyltransferase
MPEEFIIREANSEDMTRVFHLSNDPVVRQNSINQNKICLEKHKNWFEKQLNKIDAPFFIIENNAKQFIAQVRFSKKEETIISISISKDDRGKGLASQIIKNCTQKSKLSPVYAYIKKENIASIKSFKKAQYTIISDTIINDIEFWKMKYES